MSRVDMVLQAVEFFRRRQGDIRVTKVNGEDLGTVTSIEDHSKDGKAILFIAFLDGSTRTICGTASDTPGVGDDYFYTKCVFPKLGTDLPLDKTDRDYRFGPVVEGTIPVIQIWDGGYEDYSNEPSNASPRSPEHTLTLIDSGAAEFNTPLLKAHLEKLKREHQERLEKVASDSRARKLEADAAAEAQLAAFQSKAIDVRALFAGHQIKDVQLIGDHADQIRGLEFTLADDCKITIRAVAVEGGKPSITITPIAPAGDQEP